MVNVAVLISGGGTNLQALIDKEKTGVIQSAKISLVVSSNPEAYGLLRAKNAGIKTAVVDRKNYTCKNEFEEELLKVIKEENIGIVVLAGFMLILSKDFLEKLSLPVINVHPSLIPSFCGEGYYGLKVHEKALEYGVKVSGATVHFVNEVPDGGKIIMQKAVDILENDTPEILQKRIMREAEHVILPLSLEKVAKEIEKKKGEVK